MKSGLSAPRAAWLLTRLRLTRLLNRMQFIYNRPLGRAKSRPASSRKKGSRWLVTGLVALGMLSSFGNVARQSIENLHLSIDGAAIGHSAPRHARQTTPRAASALQAGPFSESLTRGLAMELSLLLGAAMLMSLGTRELSQPDWDLELLFTLPVRSATLLWCRIAERTLANPSGILSLWPAGALIAWYSGFRWSALFFGALAVMPLLLLSALARTLVDTGLRMSLPPSKLRNLQALISIVSILLLYLAISIGMPAPLPLVLDWARAFPLWASYLPAGLVVRALNAGTGSEQAMLALLLCAEVALALVAGVRLLQYQLRNGVVTVGSRETARRRSGMRDRPTGLGWLSFGTAVQRRELRLLSRDRNFLVQTLVLPVVIVVCQLAINGGWGVHSPFSLSHTAMATVAFAIAAYALMLSAFQTLHSEGGSLWMLFTVPRSLESILGEKARLWAALALLYPVAVFAIGIYFNGHVDVEMVGLAAIVVLGVPIYAAIAVSLGVFGCDPLAQEAATNLRLTYVYLYMLLASMYAYAILASEWWQRLVLIVLSALLALALWQKARDELPYVLDPAASPPARVSSSDGLIAAMMFFVFQGLTTLVLTGGDHRLSAAELIVAYALAGALTYGLVRYSYWRSKTEMVPRVWGMRPRQAVGWGAAAGVLAALAGLAYIQLSQRLGLTPEVTPLAGGGLTQELWLLALVVVAAPLFEEFLFRGLIFGGLRRTWSAGPAIIASAAVFAIVHPPTSMIPVFGLGVCAAAAYNRTRMLLAPMIAHAIYNGAIVGQQLLQR
jgi:ABC-2 type transport system permease protein